MTPTDDELLRAVADLYARLDPAPDDLADGVLARLAMEGLETEWQLLTLVERVDLAAGTRAGAAEPETTSAVALEFAGTSYRVLVRISVVDGARRIDGWVLPTAPTQVLLGRDDEHPHLRQETSAGPDGRFEFPAPPTGEVRLWLLPHGAPGEQTPLPFVTPPFLV